MLQPREIKEDGVRFCARVQRLRVACEGGTSITRYIGQRKRRRSRRRKGVVGIAQGGREAGVRARVVERQIVRHLTHLIPYLTPSPVTTLIHPFLCYQLSSNVSPYTLTSLSLSLSLHPLGRLVRHFIVLLFLLFLHPLPYALPLDGPRRAAASKALDYLPLISARVAHLLPRLPRLPRPKDQPPSPASTPALPFSRRFPPFVSLSLSLFVPSCYPFLFPSFRAYLSFLYFPSLLLSSRHL